MTDRTMRIDLDRLIMLSEEHGGVCLACGEDAYGVEPDARRYTCEECGAAKVYGAEELMMMGVAE